MLRRRSIQTISTGFCPVNEGFLCGGPLLNLDSILSSNFVVQYRTNLADTNWINLLSLTNLPASPYLFLDSGGLGQPARFYRAVME